MSESYEILVDANPAAVVEQYALRITASWQRAAQSVIETAIALRNAQADLQKRDFTQVKARLKSEGIMHPSTVTKLLKIAENPVLTSPQNVAKLPASYATLYDLSRRDVHQVEDALNTGMLKASTVQKDLKAIFQTSTAFVTRKGKTTDEVVSIRLKGSLSDVPVDVLSELNTVLKKIEEFLEVSVKGMND